MVGTVIFWSSSFCWVATASTVEISTVVGLKSAVKFYSGIYDSIFKSKSYPFRIVIGSQVANPYVVRFVSGQFGVGK